MKNDLTAVHRLNARVGGESLLSLLIRNRLSPASDCNGLGLCGKCKVQIVQGTASPLCSEETEHLRKKELDAGFRLACLCRVEGEVMITSSEPEISMQIQEQGFTACTFPLNPVIKKQLIVLEPQTHESRYQCLVSKTGVPIENTLAIAGALADSPSMLTAVKFQNRLIGIETADTRSTGFGIAVDIGTTTLVAALIDFNTGKTLATASAINPQFQLGSDVLSRIHFAQQSPSHLDMLSSLLRNEINRLAADLLETAGADPTQCYLISVAGNTVMLHLLLGIDPRPLGRHPYQPVFLETLEVKASDLDIALSPFAVLQCLPGLSAFIGADIQAGLLALNLTKNTDNTLFIDMGTNGEIVLCFNGKMIATSTAAGPALEGMNISCGMKACNGAIDHVMLSGNKLDWTTIGDASPKGLCGSGLLDLVAALLKTGIIQKSGRIVPPETAALNGVEQIENSRCFRLVQPGAENNDRGIYISQQDIRQVQLAKGSLAAGMKLLLRQVEATADEIKVIYLAGGFGHYLSPETLITLGLFPSIWKHRIMYAGNTSLSGAKLSMLCEEQLTLHPYLAGKIEFLDLTDCNEFKRMFANEMLFSDCSATV